MDLAVSPAPTEANYTSQRDKGIDAYQHKRRLEVQAICNHELQHPDLPLRHRAHFTGLLASAYLDKLNHLCREAYDMHTDLIGTHPNDKDIKKNQVMMQIMASRANATSTTQHVEWEKLELTEAEQDGMEGWMVQGRVPRKLGARPVIVLSRRSKPSGRMASNLWNQPKRFWK
jgi:hypothetical protein